MTNRPGDLTRQWVNLAKQFPARYREDEEILRWVAERRIGPLVALLEADMKEAREELYGLRRRYPKDFERARRENRRDYIWQPDKDHSSDHLSDKKWKEYLQKHDQQEAEYEWVEEEYRYNAFVLKDRRRLIENIHELVTLEGTASSESS